MHIAILLANSDSSAFAGRHPGDDIRFTAMMQAVRPGWRLSALDVTQGHYPADAGDYDGYIITGSPASANDPDLWIDRLKAFIRTAARRQVPQFGACFGHQVIAAALGGRVEQSAGGWRLGLHETPTSADAAYLADAGQPIALYAAHKDQVTALPPGAVNLGGTDDCPIGAFALGTSVFATQYHPEMDPAFITALIEELARDLPPALTARARASLSGRADMVRFATWVARFFELATGAQGHAASRSIAVT